MILAFTQAPKFELCMLRALEAKALGVDPDRLTVLWACYRTAVQCSVLKSEIFTINVPVWNGSK